MNPGLKASASGMRAQQQRIDVIANNLANVNTTAFKRSRVSFQDALYETLQGTRLVNYQNAESLAAVQVGKGVRVAGIDRIHAAGALEPTGRATDFAIEGDGFFQVQLADGTFAYTRDGAFSVSDTGSLVTRDGFGLQPPITIPPEGTELTVSPSGLVSVRIDRGGDRIELGQLQLARFMNPTGLETIGQNLYVETPASGPVQEGFAQEPGFGQIVQGMLETSNVEIVQEMVDMITAQRAYEVNSKAISTAEEMIENAVNGLIR